MNVAADKLDAIDEVLDKAGVCGPDPRDTVQRVEVLVAAWEEMHREAKGIAELAGDRSLVLEKHAREALGLVMSALRSGERETERLGQVYDRGFDAVVELARRARLYEAARGALELCIREGSPARDWVAIPHEEWRVLLSALQPDPDWQPRRVTGEPPQHVEPGKMLLLTSDGFVEVDPSVPLSREDYPGLYAAIESWSREA